MSFDGSFTHSIKIELNQLLSSGRISKINQPYPNELILTIRAHGKNNNLLLSANPNFARVQITAVPYVNPAVPNNFTMLMRKYLSGAILNSVEQPKNDRMLCLNFSSRNELGDQMELGLVTEIMARHSNIILVDKSNNKILDAIKHVGPDVNRYRTLLPGAEYIQPPKQNLQDPFTKKEFSDISSLVKGYPNVDVLAEQLKHTLQGLGNDTALALANYLHKPGDLNNNFQSFFAQFDKYKPTLSKLVNNKIAFSAFPYPHTKENKTYGTLSELLDAYYTQQAQRDRVREQGNVLIEVVKKQLKKNLNKLKKLTKELAATNSADEYRIKGEILTTFLTKVKRGMSSVELPNYYDDNKLIKISISNQLYPSENAQKYFKKYQKAKNAVGYLSDQIKLTKQEIDYFENIQSQIELANPEDLTDIRSELEEGGYLKNHDQHRNRKNKRRKISKPEKFTASDGTTILVGKNNLQNEKLTMHTADKRDTWLHTQKIPGSHVIIQSFDPSEQTLQEAAELAAYFSKARNSTKVPVDYTRVKNIRKPNGTKPGYVIYDSQKTLLVDGTGEIVNQLAQK